jgi:transcription termination factor Rho
MTKAELESKHIAELHELAADAGVERYRMLSRTELIEKLAGGGSSEPKAKGEPRAGDAGGRRQRDRSRKPRDGRGERKPRESRGGGREERKAREPRQKPVERSEPKPEPPTASATTLPPERPKRKRRRRRWGRRRKGVRLPDLLLPATAGRQAIVFAENREACTSLLREAAAELSGASSGPDPLALLVDPSPEELAEWKREAPEVEIVSAGKAGHAGDALAQARARADRGEEVIVLIDSLTRFAESFGDGEGARELLDAGLGATGGSLTVVAALERPA